MYVKYLAEKDAMSNVEKTGVIKSDVVLMTPDLCRVHLAKNSINRPFRQSKIDAYADSMLNGEWKLNGEPIIIDEHGNLLSGQHRMMACISAGVSFETVITVGVQTSGFDTIDTGIKRSGSDVIYINNKNMKPEVARDLSSAITRCITFEMTGGVSKSGQSRFKMTPKHVSEFLDENQRLIEIANNTHSAYGRKTVMVKGEIIFLHFYMERIDREKTETFFEGVILGAGLELEDPRLVFRNKILAQKNSQLKWNPAARMGAACRAWAWHMKGQRAKHPANMFRDLDSAFDLIQSD